MVVWFGKSFWKDFKTVLEEEGELSWVFFSFLELCFLLFSFCFRVLEWAGRFFRGRGSLGDMYIWVVGKLDYSVYVRFFRR